jgi:hypothetical protein
MVYCFVWRAIHFFSRRESSVCQISFLFNQSLDSLLLYSAIIWKRVFMSFLYLYVALYYFRIGTLHLLIYSISKETNYYYHTS